MINEDSSALPTGRVDRTVGMAIDPRPSIDPRLLTAPRALGNMPNHEAPELDLGHRRHHPRASRLHTPAGDASLGDPRPDPSQTAVRTRAPGPGEG
jgi:hypothetical protein